MVLPLSYINYGYEYNLPVILTVTDVLVVDFLLIKSTIDVDELLFIKVITEYSHITKH